MVSKRVLYLENGIGYGGAVVCLKLLAAHINRDHYIPIIVTSHDDQNYKALKEVADWFYLPDRLIDQAKLREKIEMCFRLFRVQGRLVEITTSMADYVINTFPYLIRLMVLARREKVNLIHLNNEPVCNMGGILVGKLLRIPCVTHVRGPTWDSRTSRWLYDRVDFVITVSNWVKKEVMKLNVCEKRVKTVWDGRNLEEFETAVDIGKLRRELDLKVGQLSVGMVGLLNPWKGHKVFISAAEKVLGEFPECKLFIVGGPAEKHRAYGVELKTMVNGRGLEKNVIFTGGRKDIGQVMRVFDVLVHASVEPDPYPNVVIEAMAVGKPIIATNIGGPPEMIENYKTGILIPPNDPALLAEKICELLRNPELRDLLGRAARNVIFERNSIQNHVRQIEEIYEMILRKDRSG